MENIPSVRATALTPYIDFCQKLGAPLEKYLLISKLPETPIHSKDAYLPLSNALDFVEQISFGESIVDLPLHARSKVVQPLTYGDSFLTSVFSAVTLKQALKAIRLLWIQENSQTNIWFVKSGDSLRICYKYDVPMHRRAGHVMELHGFLTIVSLVRSYAGMDWQPAQVALSSHVRVSSSTREQFPTTRFLRDQHCAWIECPLELLPLPPVIAGGSELADPGKLEDAPEMDFPSTLRKILHAYIGEEPIRIQDAAALADMSPRTLQRRLANCGMSFSELLQQVRYEASAKLLRDPDISIFEIASRTGWTDQSHFSRAFRSYTGMSPRQFRRQFS